MNQAEPMKILVVEDNPTDLKLLTAVLESSMHSVLGKGTAELAYMEIKNSHPSVILLDLKLPGMDGLQLARLLKNDPATRGIPIIAVTVGGSDFGRAEALAAGCDAYIIKPVDTRTLSAQVEKVVADKNGSAATG